MRSLLITGASGFLGWHACQLLAPDWEIWGTYHTHAVSLGTGNLLPLNLTDETSIQACWAAVRPSAVLHTAALAKVNHCQENPDHSRLVNVIGAVNLAARCAAAGIPFIFTSTDQVFDGTRPPYTETDPPSPINVYGQHKAAAEALILAAYPHATICRLPLMYGPATPRASCFLQDFLATIAAGQPLTLFTDEIRTPAAVTDVARGLGQVLALGITGTLHLGGPERISRYDFGLQMAAAFHLPIGALQPCLQASVSFAAPRPADVSLNSEKAFALGYAPRTVAAALRAIAAQ